MNPCIDAMIAQRVTELDALIERLEQVRADPSRAPSLLTDEYLEEVRDLLHHTLTGWAFFMRGPA